jgi:hypothetical protein
MNYLLESNIVFPSRTSPLFITLFSYQLKDNLNIKNMTLKKKGQHLECHGPPWLLLLLLLLRLGVVYLINLIKA